MVAAPLRLVVRCARQTLPFWVGSAALVFSVSCNYRERPDGGVYDDGRVDLRPARDLSVMVDAGVITRDKMKSSWAGAMGLTQFMPSEYFSTAYDLDGDGRAEIVASRAPATLRAAA